jgi:hypothetical protein
MNKHKLFFYDFEVFSNAKWWMVVLINYDTKEKTIIIDDVKQLKGFYETHKEDIFIGFNSRMYDQFILKGIISDISPFTINDKLINEGKSGYQVVKNASKIKLNNFDVSTGFHSLKQLEGFMGSRIKETSVRFDLDRKLTDQEIKEVVEYCIHDVEQTIEVFDNRKEEFDSQLSLIEAFNLDMGMFNKTKAQLSAHVLGAIRCDNREDEFDLNIVDTYRLSRKYKYIIDWYLNPMNHWYNKNNGNESNNLETVVARVPHTFAWGGLHGAVNNYVGEGIFINSDVASFYPSLMIEYGFESRNITTKGKYKEIYNRRLQLKAEKNPMQQPYKIVLNSSYGAMKDKNNGLYDPLMANNVCINGQILLLDLIEKLEDKFQLIQSNTDGVMFKVNSRDDIPVYEAICNEWSKRTRMGLEHEIITKVIQKDVNNYIVVHEDGSVKSKGGYVKKLNNIDYDLPIVNKSIKDYLIKGISVEDTINNCNKLREFQKIVKVSGLFKKALHGEKEVSERILRVFASNEEGAEGVFKVNSNDVAEKIANTPEKCFINNENIKDAIVPNNLDKNYYIELAKKRIDDFLNGKETNPNVHSDNVEELINKHIDFVDLLLENKEKSIVPNVKLIEFIKLDHFKKFGGSQSMINFLDYFKLLYGKKAPKKLTISKTINSKEIIKIISKNSEETETTYKNFNCINCLKDIWNYSHGDNINYIEKIRFEYKKTRKITYINNNISNDELFITTVNSVHTPYVIAYCINNGKVIKLKVKKETFNILEIKEGDLIKSKTFSQSYGLKFNGITSEGDIISEEDTSKIDYWLTNYDIINREY